MRFTTNFAATIFLKISAVLVFRDEGAGLQLRSSVDGCGITVFAFSFVGLGEPFAKAS